MPTDHLIAIDKGRTGVIELTLAEIPDLVNLLFRFVAVQKIGDDPAMELDGILESDGETILFEYEHVDTHELTVGSYYYEIILYKTGKTYIRTVNSGLLKILPAIKVDPTE